MKRLITKTIYIYLRMIFKKLLDNIGKSPLTWLSCISILLSFFLFDSFWTTWINKIWVEPIAPQIKKNTWWVVVTYSVIISAYYYHNLKKTETANYTRCKVVVISTFLYCICLFSKKWDYILFCDCYRYCAWSNFIFIVPTYWELYTFYRLKRKKDFAEKITPKLEIEKTNNVVDSYKRQAVCESIYTTIESCFYAEGSFAFSITGIWGSGKTTFINILKKQYNTNNSVKSVIIFEPWKNDTSDSIVKGFFARLRDELSIYIPNISSTIDQYVELLLDEESAKPFKIIGKSLNGLANEKNPYELIKEKLERTKHKIVVFIDDIDRLNATEIKEVLRLIRNTANFPYIQFIVAYDKNYVCEILKNNGINTPDRYLEKFFNVEMSLPKSEERVICNELLTRFQGTINTIWGLEKTNTSIENMIYYRPNDPTNSIIDNNLVTQILHTIRDVIRFHNSFYLLAETYKKQKVENEICFQDLFFLELLRYRYLDIYTILCNKPFTLLQLSDNIFLLNNDYKKTLQGYLDNEQLEIVSNTLEYLFNDKKPEHSIYNLRSYYKYFMYRLDDKILTVDEFMSLAEKNDSEIIESAKLLYNNKYRLEFEYLISEVLVQIYKTDKDGKTHHYTKIYNLLKRLSRTTNRGFRNEIFNAIIPHLQHLRCIDSRHFKALLDLFNFIDLHSNTVIKFNAFNFLMTILVKKNLAEKFMQEFSIEQNYEIVYDFLSNTTHTDIFSPAISSFMDSVKENPKIFKDGLLIDLSILSDIQLKYFENEQNKLTEKGFTLFHNCISEIDQKTNKVCLRQEALNMMKDAIVRHPKEYFKTFIRTAISSHPEYNTVFPDPYCADIFGSNAEFETFLSNIENENQDIIRVKNYWNLYKNNRYRPIEFNRQGIVQKKIDNCFINEIKLLYQLNYIKMYLNRGGNINDKLIKLFEKSNLNIHLRAVVYQMIEERKKNNTH